jgi:DNA-directed RNA polymerase specialized sigma24 family protein
MAQGTTLEDVARLAVDGDREALDSLVQALQGDIYGLALRMLWNREDAEDATQEILVCVVTRLSQFDFRSKLKTWVYRVAVNYVLELKKSPVERMHLTFERFAEDLAEGLSANGPLDARRSLLTAEVKIGCTLGMLQCLDRPHRLAYVLGEIWTCPGLRQQTPWRSLPTFSASAFNARAPPSRHLHMPTAGWHRTLLCAPATVVCRQRCVSDESAPMASNSQPTLRPFRRLARSSGRSMKRGGLSRSTGPAILGPPPSTSRVASSRHSTPRGVRSDDLKRHRRYDRRLMAPPFGVWERHLNQGVDRVEMRRPHDTRLPRRRRGSG